MSPGRGEVLDYMLTQSDRILVLVVIDKPIFLVPETDQSDVTNNSKDHEKFPKADGDAQVFNGIWIDSHDLKVLGVAKSSDAQIVRRKIHHRGGGNHRLHHHHHSLSPFFPGGHVCYKALPQGCSFLDDANLVSRRFNWFWNCRKNGIYRAGKS